MCFSAEASFAAGAVLTPAGIYCVRTALQRDRRTLALAVIPIAFAVQQVFEGFVWVGLGRNDAGLTRAASLGFLLFALVVWPAWIPFSIRPLEQRPWARRTLGGVAAAAFGLSLLYFVPLVMHAGAWLRTDVLHHSIRYDLESVPPVFGLPRLLWQAGYIGVVGLPMLVPGNGRLTVFSGMVVASAVLTHVAFAYAYVSVWCAFAAVLSAWLCYVFHGLPARRGAAFAPLS